MANELVSNNVFIIDTFNAGNVAIGTGRVQVKSVLVMNAGAIKTCKFVDASGKNVLPIQCPANSTTVVAPAGGFDFYNGLTFDNSNSGLASGDYAIIYLHNPNRRF